MKKVFKLDFDGRELVAEAGELAKQTNGAVLVRYGDTAVLSVCVMGKTPVSQDFFPLQVLYQERLYSVGKIPGGFIKREGRPSDAATLAARLIDRPIRPMFDENLRNEIQVINTVLSVDQDNSPEMTALFGSSLCLGISNIPFDGPVAGVIVGLVDGKFVINPTAEQNEISELHLTVAGTKDAINMVEADAKEVDEDTMLNALMFGHEAIKELIAFVTLSSRDPKSITLAPSFRNSGLLATSKSILAFRLSNSSLMAAFTFWAVPTGTVLLVTTKTYLFILIPIVCATSNTYFKSALPFSSGGVPTAQNTISTSFKQEAKSVEKFNLPSR